MRIVNGTAYDAVAVLVQIPGYVPRRAIYIRSEEAGLITGVATGTYTLRFQLGSFWRADGRFCEIAKTAEFDEPLEFYELESYYGVTYPEWEVTLHSVPGGTASTHAIPAASFKLPSF